MMAFTTPSTTLPADRLTVTRSPTLNCRSGFLAGTARLYWCTARSGRGRSTQLHGLTVRWFTYTNTSVLVGRGLTTRTATAWTIGARIFVEFEEPKLPFTTERRQHKEADHAGV